MSMPTEKLVAAMRAYPDVMVGRLWANIPGFDSYYVSDDGVVLSLLNRPRVLSPIKMGEYVGLQLKGNDGRKSKRYLHRIVAEAFHGAPAEGQKCCRHLDGDKRNNSFANLAWGTYSENAADTKRHGTALCGERNPMAKLSSEAVEKMRRIRAEAGLSFKSIAAQFGVSTMTAFRAITGQAWR